MMPLPKSGTGDRPVLKEEIELQYRHSKVRSQTSEKMALFWQGLNKNIRLVVWDYLTMMSKKVVASYIIGFLNAKGKIVSHRQP